ncbi:MAG: hypothetical protein HZA08_08120 [Nitrospirae bacterium]|nr:hypothetical protein [Nitrospirota bacterium]
MNSEQFKIIQIVPPDWCFKCDVCCRFPESTSFLAPYFTAEEINRVFPPPLAGVGQEESKNSLPFKGRDRVGMGLFPNKSGCKITLIAGGEAYICPAFDLPTAHCLIYNVRPFDCELYPYALMRDESGENVVIGVDTKCPYVRENIGANIFTAAASDIANAIESSPLIEIISENRDLIGPFQDDVISLIMLKKLSDLL